MCCRAPVCWPFALASGAISYNWLMYQSYVIVRRARRPQASDFDDLLDHKFFLWPARQQETPATRKTPRSVFISLFSHLGVGRTPKRLARRQQPPGCCATETRPENCDKAPAPTRGAGVHLHLARRNKSRPFRAPNFRQVTRRLARLP